MVLQFSAVCAYHKCETISAFWRRQGIWFPTWGIFFPLSFLQSWGISGHFRRALCDCCFVLPSICCAENPEDRAVIKGRKQEMDRFHSQWNSHTSLSMVRYNYLATSVSFSNACLLFFFSLCLLQLLPTSMDARCKRYQGLFIRGFCFERKGLIFCSALLYSVLCS